MLTKKKKTPSLSWFVLMLIPSLLSCSSGSVKIPDATDCTVAGTMNAGADCMSELSEKKTHLTLEEYIDFLNPMPEHADPNDPTHIIPARAGAISESTKDFVDKHTALEQACALLKSRCTWQIKQALKTSTKTIHNLVQVHTP